MRRANTIAHFNAYYKTNIHPTPAPTATPTELPLPEVLKGLQEKLGTDFKLIEIGELDSANNKIYSIKNKEGQIIPDVKIFTDSTSELTYSFQGQSEDLTIAFQAVSAENGALNIGPWQYKDAEWTMLIAAAPKTVEDADSFPKLAYLEGHAKEKEIDLIIHRYV